MPSKTERRVVVTDWTFPTLEAEERAAEQAGATFRSHQCRSEADVVEAITGADVVLVQFAPVRAGALATLAPGARVIRYGVGYDNIDVSAAARRGVGVAYVPDYCTAEVADHTATMILATLRKLTPLDASVRDGEWAAVATMRPTPTFASTTIGFVGFGRIGRAVMERLRPFGFAFLVFDPMLDDARVAELGARRAPTLESLLAEADLATLHVPSSSTTRGMMNRTTLARMKSTAAVVNTARGDLIVEEDLAAALNGGRLAAAALDVFGQEPLPSASPLRTARGLLLSPHAAWYSDASIARLQHLASDEVRRALAGEPPRCPVPMLC